MNLFNRFKHTFDGCIALIQKDKNYIIHVLIAIIVVIFGFIHDLTSTEWLFIATAIMLVLLTEAINTAIETTVDLVTQKYHPLAKQAKDISAFAVLIASIYAVIVALIIFVPYWI